MKKRSLLFLGIFGFLNASDGNLDNSFGVHGLARISEITYPAVSAYVVGTFIQADGKIVIGGTLESSRQGYIMCTTPKGNLDTFFNSSGPIPGVLTLDLTKGSNINNILVQPDGKIVAVGGASGDSILITRLNPNGSFDRTFGDGYPIFTSTPISGLIPDSFAVALDKTGGLTVVGVLFNNTKTASDLIIIRYNADGTLNTSFNGSGFAVLNVIVNGIPLPTIGNSIAIQADQKIVVAGHVVLDSSATPFFIARYNINGALDPTFQDGSAQPGVIVDALSNSTSGPFLIIQPDQKILLGITNLDDASGQNYPQLIRYNSDATPDSMFNRLGRTSAFFDGTNSITSNFIGLQSDGKVVSAGGVSSISLNPFAFSVVRFTGSGELDTTFGASSGYVLTSFPGQINAFARSLALQRNGYIIATGFSGSSTTQLLSLARYQVSTPLLLTTLFWLGGLSFGTAQPKSIVELNHNTASVVKVDSVDGFWSCPISTTSSNLSAIAHYPGGCVNIPSIAVRELAYN